MTVARAVGAPENSFDPSVGIELSYINQLGRNEEMQSAIQIPDKKDGFDEIRLEFREMLKNQIVKGNNGLRKSKYITFTEIGRAHV